MISRRRISYSIHSAKMIQGGIRNCIAGTKHFDINYTAFWILWFIFKLSDMKKGSWWDQLVSSSTFELGLALPARPFSPEFGLISEVVFGESEGHWLDGAFSLGSSLFHSCNTLAWYCPHSSLPSLIGHFLRYPSSMAWQFFVWWPGLRHISHWMPASCIMR